jgi:ABC-type lipoprotein export system ATPase subunit
MRQIISQIHSQLEEFVEGRPSSKCPACGYKYKTVDDLKLAFQKTAQEIVNEMSVEIDEEIVKQKSVLGKEIAALKEQKSSSLLTEAKIEKQLAVSQEFLDKLISQVRDASAIIRAAGFSIELSEDMTPEDQAAKLVSIPLNETLDEVRKAKTLLIEENHKTWNGLRREQYLEEKQLIEETLTSLKEKQEDLGFQFPIELSEPEWLKLQKGTKKIQDTTVQKLKDAELKGEKNRKEITNLKDKLQKAQKEFERISQNLATEKAYKEKLGILVSRIKLLIEWGLFPTDKVIDLSAIKKQLAEGAIALETFEKSISQYLEDDKLKTDLERRIKLAHSKQDTLDKQRKKLKGFEKNLRKAKNPNERAAQVWQQHETTINNFFTTLHWPRDFKDVRLENDKGLELTVSNVTAPEDRHPAHLRLSAGQRSALAISVFWTLNTAFPSIPDIILMDEPVQNIDELNILNFLDGLRWFVETTNKQVFLTTASQRIQALARKKFAYLKNDFIEVRLRRESGCSQVKYFDWKDNEILSKGQEVSSAVLRRGRLAGRPDRAGQNWLV